MQERYVGRSGLRVSRVGLGTASWGAEVDEHEAADQLGCLLDAGGYVVDTAAAYGGGAAEELLGELSAGRFDRDDLVIVSKAGLRRRDGRSVPDASRGALLDDLDRSLRRLRTDRLDLWLVHLWDPRVPLEETLSALDVAVSSGRVRYVGVSNFDGWQVAQASTRQACTGGAPIVAAQSEYSLLNREVEAEVLPAGQSLGVGLLAWSPLGRGVLTGKYRAGIPSDSRAASDHQAAFVEPYLGAESRQVVESVVRAAEGLSMQPAQIALAWVRDRPGVASAIVGARTAAQLKATLSAEDLDLPGAIADALSDVSEGLG